MEDPTQTLGKPLPPWNGFPGSRTGLRGHVPVPGRTLLRADLWAGEAPELGLGEAGPHEVQLISLSMDVMGQRALHLRVGSDGEV